MIHWTAAEWQMFFLGLTSFLGAVAGIIAAIKGGQAQQTAARAVEKIDQHITQSAEQANETQAIIRGDIL